MLVFISWFLSDLWHVKLRFWRAAKDIKWLKWVNGLRASRTRHWPKSEPSLPRMKDLTLLIVSCIWDWEPHDYIEVDEIWRHNLTTGYYWNIFCQAAMGQAAARERERELVTFSNAYAQNAKFLPLLAKGLGEGNAMLQGARFHQLGFECWPWPAQQVWIVVPTRKLSCTDIVKKKYFQDTSLASYGCNWCSKQLSAHPHTTRYCFVFACWGLVSLAHCGGHQRRLNWKGEKIARFTSGLPWSWIL